MNTRDLDRCPAGHDWSGPNMSLVVQCQGSINHDGDHFFCEDHYTVHWDDAKTHPENL